MLVGFDTTSNCWQPYVWGLGELSLSKSGQTFATGGGFKFPGSYVSTVPLESEHQLRVMLRAGPVARFVITASPISIEDARATYARLRDDLAGLESEAAREQQEWAARTLHIATPDEAVNHALAWSQWALEQAWVCNPALGCGLVAGYGPSRGLARR